MSSGYAILLSRDTATDFLIILDGYIREKDTLKFVLSKSIDIGNQFTSLEIIRDKMDSPWRISIPNYTIIAITELDPKSPKFGFMP